MWVSLLALWATFWDVVEPRLSYARWRPTADALATHAGALRRDKDPAQQRDLISIVNYSILTRVMLGLWEAPWCVGSSLKARALLWVGWHRAETKSSAVRRLPPPTAAHTLAVRTWAHVWDADVRSYCVSAHHILLFDTISRIRPMGSLITAVVGTTPDSFGLTVLETSSRHVRISYVRVRIF